MTRQYLSDILRINVLLIALNRDYDAAIYFYNV